MTMAQRPIPPKQTAIIFQGGGALGAYEAGVFDSIYDKLKSQNRDWMTNMFDIVAGASIGAVNATVLVDHFQNNRTWGGASATLTRFWQNLENPPS